MHSPPPSPALHQQYTPPPPTDPRESPWYPYDNGAGFDANIAMILIFLFCALLCALALNAAIRFFLRRSRRSRNFPSNSHLPTHNSTDSATSTAAAAADKLTTAASLSAASPPTLAYSAGIKLAGATAECAICLSEFVNGEGVRVLPRCKHGFHVKCIEGWLSSHSSCPTCRSSCLATSPDKSPLSLQVPVNSEINTFDIESQSEPSIQQQHHHHHHQERREPE